MNVCPLVRLSIEGISRETTLAGAAMSFFVQGMPALSALVVLTAIAFFAGLHQKLEALLGWRTARRTNQGGSGK